MKQEDDSAATPTPEPESDSSGAATGGEPTRDRRDFLRRLGTMTFLTAAVLRGAVPAASASPTDGECGTVSIGQVVYKDEDCSAANPPDLDCGLFNGTGWQRHEDKGCMAKPHSDSDCGKLATEQGRHKDNCCGNVFATNEAFADEDCNGLLPTEPGVHQDNDCLVGGEYADVDCGYATGTGAERHRDDDCTEGGTYASGHDNDCGLWGASPTGGYHQDNDCQTSTLDSDCGGSTGGGTHPDNDCHVPSGGGSSTDNAPPPTDG